MSVIAKFNVSSIETFQYGSVKVNMQPVYPQKTDDPDAQNPEDEKFWKATPQGLLWMVVDNPAAAEQFQPGDKFYLTFERVPEESAS